MNDSPPILIVGQGLAGSLLAWELVRLGKGVVILDAPDAHAASPVSAGILNPVTGKRIVKSWRVDQFHPVAVETYALLEKELKQRFFEPRPIVRLFQSPEEVELWEQRTGDPEYESWLGQRFAPGFLGGEVKDPHGSFAIRGGGWLAIRPLVDQLRGWFCARGLLVEAPFEPADIELPLSGDALLWRGQPYERIVFCQGYRGADNPWFDWLDYRLSRGEILDVEVSSELPDCILNRGMWILPSPSGTARIGATYQWDHLEAGTTTSGLVDLLKGAGELHSGRFAIRGHRAGIRPGTNDSRPYLGTHPLDARLAILNGLGSKGSLYGPPAARDLARHLVSNHPLEPEWDVQRRLKFLSEPLRMP